MGRAPVDAATDSTSCCSNETFCSVELDAPIANKFSVAGSRNLSNRLPSPQQKSYSRFPFIIQINPGVYTSIPHSSTINSLMMKTKWANSKLALLLNKIKRGKCINYFKITHISPLVLRLTQIFL